MKQELHRRPVVHNHVPEPRQLQPSIVAVPSRVLWDQLERTDWWNQADI